MTPSGKKTILIVEDDEGIGATLKIFLETEAYEVVLANNGLVALELLCTCEFPSLILLDMKMPIMNGWEFAAAFRAKYGKQVPMVVMTAAADAEQRAREVEAVDWLEKPFRFAELLQKIKKILDSSSLPAGEGSSP